MKTRGVVLAGVVCAVLDDNAIGRDCRQRDNAIFAGVGNTAGRSIDGCNPVSSAP
jgi:hypothetical protein